ncbi:MAG: LysM peptidoglycan-binding domain-containing protein [Myxococcales bacterium]|nr:MAG: LysM peptidoglycan-binding domain-containing protein [Myxococcales bacterium]
MGFWDKVKDAVTGAEDPQGKAAPQPEENIEIKDASEPDVVLGEPQAPKEPEHVDQPAAAPAPAEAKKPAPRPEKKDAPKAEKKPDPKPEKKAEPKLRTYTVKSGDTLSEIAQEFGVNYMDIARLNDIKNPDLIYPGQVFKIPNK